MEIQSARFVDKKCTKMEVKFVSKNGKVQRAQFTAPADYEKGKNKIFDEVMEKYDIADLMKETRQKSNEDIQKERWKRERDKNAEESKKQNMLFKEKVNFLDTAIMENSTRDQRRALRKANTVEKFNMIKTEIVRQYAEENEISFFDAVMIIDKKKEQDSEDE